MCVYIYIYVLHLYLYKHIIYMFMYIYLCGYVRCRMIWVCRKIQKYAKTPNNSPAPPLLCCLPVSVAIIVDVSLPSPFSFSLHASLPPFRSLSFSLSFSIFVFVSFPSFSYVGPTKIIAWLLVSKYFPMPGVATISRLLEIIGLFCRI